MENRSIGRGGEDLITQQGEQIEQRRTSRFASPFRERQVFGGALEAGAEKGCRQEQTVPRHRAAVVGRRAPEYGWQDEECVSRVGSENGCC